MDIQRPNPKRVVVELEQQGGNIAVEKTDDHYIVWMQIDGLSELGWDIADRVATLPSAMNVVATMITNNIENGFYE